MRARTGLLIAAAAVAASAATTTTWEMNSYNGFPVSYTHLTLPTSDLV